MIRNLPLRGALFAYLLLVVISVWSFASQGDLSFGRNPLANLARTASDLARPSFLDVWFGPERLEYHSDDGRLLRVEDRRAVERSYLLAVAEATWTTMKIGTLGAFLAAVLALPLGFTAARNVQAPRVLAGPARALLDVARSIHTLVFGLVYVGIVGLGPMAGILAIASHSLGRGLGLLVSEAVSLFPWSRLATLLIVVAAMVVAMDRSSAWMRRRLLAR